VSWLLLIASAIGMGMASAVVPVVNAEAMVAAAGAGLPLRAALITAVALAVGQTIGKILLFEAARRGRRLKERSGRPSRALRPWQQRLMDRLSGRWAAGGTVLASAGLGLPPLALVSVAAGMAGTRRLDFAACCLFGRIARFLIVAGALTVVA